MLIQDTVIRKNIRENKSKSYSDEDAVAAAVESCLKDGILEEVLKKERDKVENILMRGLTEEEKKKLERMELEYSREKGYNEGLEKGIAEGLAKGEASARIEGVNRLASSGMATIEEACNILGVPYEEYKNYKSEG